MASASESYHESLDKLSEETKDMHRALVSVQEELEAVDWYRQRADACSDPELRAVLLHNMREEIEHACMVLEWLRRRNPDFQEQMSTYLFTEKPILQVEEEEEEGGGGEKSSRSLNRFTIGKLKG
ncbi:MAG: ferritin-like domain-containing protein [Candidatus Competibacteraceae bacterium]|nr:ferritin-like domain-containing protein [Candidatus Competibacteraceae bacterium]